MAVFFFTKINLKPVHLTNCSYVTKNGNGKVQNRSTIFAGFNAFIIVKFSFDIYKYLKTSII